MSRIRVPFHTPRALALALGGIYELPIGAGHEARLRRARRPLPPPGEATRGTPEDSRRELCLPLGCSSRKRDSSVGVKSQMGVNENVRIVKKRREKREGRREEGWKGLYK